MIMIKLSIIIFPAYILTPLLKPSAKVLTSIRDRLEERIMHFFLRHRHSFHLRYLSSSAHRNKIATIKNYFYNMLQCVMCI